MGRMATPSLYPGERSLPAELRTTRGIGFAQRRLAASLQPSASPTSWNAMRLRGLMGLGQDDDSTDLNSGDVDLNQLVPEVISPLTDSSGNVDIPLPAAGTATYTGTNTVNLTSVFTGMGVDPTVASTVSGYVSAPSGYTGPTVAGPSATTPAAPTGYQWATLINSEGNTLAKVLTIAQGGSSVTLPNGTQLLYGASSGTASTALSALSSVTGLSSTTIMLIGAGVLVFFLMEGRK